MGYDYRDQGVITGIEKGYNEGLILGTHLLYSQSVLKGHAVNLSSNKILIGENTKVNGNILMAYNHDYINSYHIDGDIAQNRNSNFRIKSKRPDKDYVTIQGGTTFTVRDNLDVTLEVGTDLFRQKSSSVNTSLTFEWKF